MPLSPLLPGTDPLVEPDLRQLREGLHRIERSIAEAVVGFDVGRHLTDPIPGDLIDLALARSALAVSAASESIEAVASEARRIRMENPLQAALKENSEAHVRALRAAGLPSSVLDIMESWVGLQVEGRVLQRQLELDQLLASMAGTALARTPAALERHPVEFLSATELGKRLGISDETVRRREAERALFSILRPGRKRGREYPAFQLWPGIAGEPLAKVLAALDPDLGSAVYGFFVAPNELLEGLAPVEALSGKTLSSRGLEAGALTLLTQSPEERLQAVIGATKSYTLGR